MTTSRGALRVAREPAQRYRCFPLPTVDGLLAATALMHDLTIVTRNERDFSRSGASVLNPFSKKS